MLTFPKHGGPLLGVFCASIVALLSDENTSPCPLYANTTYKYDFGCYNMYSCICVPGLSIDLVELEIAVGYTCRTTHACYYPMCMHKG